MGVRVRSRRGRRRGVGARDREVQLLAGLLLADRGPPAVGRDGHRPRPGRPRVARAPGRAPRPPHHAPRRLPRGRGRRLRAPRAVRIRPGGQRTPWWPGSSSCSAATSSATRCSSTASPPRCSGCPEPPRRSGASRPGRMSRPGCSSSSRSGCPRWPAELAAGRAGLGDGHRPLPHGARGHRASTPGSARCSTELDDGALPGVREGVERVERDERWHIGFGLRCLIEAEPSPELLEDVLAQAEDAAAAWGDAVPPPRASTPRRMCAPAVGRRADRRARDAPRRPSRARSARRRTSAGGRARRRAPRAGAARRRAARSGRRRGRRRAARRRAPRS